MEGEGGAVVNIDMSPVEEIAKLLKGDPESMLKDIAIRLYANSDFDHTSKSASQIADACIERAKVLLTKLG